MPTIFPANPAATDQVIMRKATARIGSVDRCHCQPYQAVEASNPTPTNAAPIYGVAALAVDPDATSQGVALLRQYRDGALKQAGNTSVTLLQEAD